MMASACATQKQLLDAGLGKLHSRLDPLVEVNVELEARLSPWLERRSVGPRRLLHPGPDAHETALLLRTVRTAPDHGRLRPCRLKVLSAAERTRLGIAFQNYKLRVAGLLNAEDAEREMARATSGPCLFAVVVRVDLDHPEIPVHEQWATVGAVIANLLSAAHALGYAGKMLSGARVRAPEVCELLCDADEELAGFVYLGTSGQVANESHLT